MYSASGSSSGCCCCCCCAAAADDDDDDCCCGCDGAALPFVEEEEDETREGNCSTTWPASQSRLSALSGPPQLFCTARVSAGQRLRERATACSKRDWRVSVKKERGVSRQFPRERGGVCCSKGEAVGRQRGLEEEGGENVPAEGASVEGAIVFRGFVWLLVARLIRDERERERENYEAE